MNQSANDNPPASKSERRPPRPRALVVGLFLAIGSAALAVVLVEAGCWVANKISPPGLQQTQQLPDNYKTYGPPYGYRLTPNVQGRAIKWVDGKVAFDVVYSSDADGFRVTPVENPEDRDRFAIFIGCSITYGEGVNDTETMPTYFGRHAPRYMPYNFGCSGYGLQQPLLMMQRGEIQKKVKQNQGVIIYTFIRSHIDRAIGSMKVYSAWARGFPCYEIGPSGLEYRGSFEEVHPTRYRCYDFLRRSQFLKRFNIDMPPVLTQKHLVLMAEMIRVTRDEFLKAYPGSEFVVILHPGGALVYGPRLIPYLQERGIRYLNYQTLFQDVDWPTILPDFHPTPRMNEELVKKMIADLAIPTPPATP